MSHEDRRGMRIAAPDGSPDRKNVQDRSREQMLKVIECHNCFYLPFCILQNKTCQKILQLKSIFLIKGFSRPYGHACTIGFKAIFIKSNLKIIKIYYRFAEPVISANFLE